MNQPTVKKDTFDCNEKGKSNYKQLGKYALTAQLGHGGMGEVYLSHHPSLHIPLAIKILKKKHSENHPEYIQRFVQESRLAAKVNHPNLVRIYDADKQDETYFLVMEYIKGKTVWQLMQNGDWFSCNQALSLAIKVASALKEAQKHKIIHRDIKPDNILITEEGEVKVADLGIAKQLNENDRNTKTGTVIGTPHYMSPEQCLGVAGIDFRSDIYSLGATLYHLLTQSVPFDDDSALAIMMKHSQNPLIHPKVMNSELPENFCAVICKMMEKAPANRYSSYDSLIQDLKSVRDNNTPVEKLIATTSFDSLVGRPALSTKAKPFYKTILGPFLFIIIVLIGGAIYMFYGKTSMQAPRLHVSESKEFIAEIEFGKDWSIPQLQIRLLPITAGTFRMGAQPIELEQNGDETSHIVTISKPFWMQQTETTNETFNFFVSKTNYQTEAEQKQYSYSYVNGTWVKKRGLNWKTATSDPQSPVSCITWNDAVNFCNWLTDREKKDKRLPEGYSYRLPTEAEWEYCCRAGSDGKFSGELKNVVCYANERTGIPKVGSKRANAWGLYDMQGSVWELCLDRCSYNKGVETETYKGYQIDPFNKDGVFRIVRGGSWLSPLEECRSANRAVDLFKESNNTLGFRVVLASTLKGQIINKK